MLTAGCDVAEASVRKYGQNRSKDAVPLGE